MQDEFVTCRNCGREIPNTLYCIYCGVALSKEVKKPKTVTAEKKTDEEVEQVELKPIPKIAGDVFSKSPLEEFTVRVETPSVIDAELDQETLHLMGDLRKYYIWKAKLCGLLVEDRVSEEVFTKIYEEYVKEIDQLSEIWNEKIRDYRKRCDEKKAELKKYKLEQEELRVRVAVGQIPDSDLFIRTPQLIDVINSLNTEASKLEAKISKLNNLIWGAPGKEVSELKKTVRKCIESLDGLVINGKICEELRGQLLEDLNGVLTMLNSTTGDEKEKLEKELKNELETLEVRYKIGEISLTQFNSLKKAILEKLDKLCS